MMKVNMTIHTIRPPDRSYSDHELYRKSIVPYLETNRLRPRIHAIQKTHPITYRAKVLGRALLAARTNVNSFWMILSGNAEVSFPPTTAATNLATPATAAATSNAASLDADAAFVPVFAAWTTFTIGTSTDADDAPPTTSTSACRKRKAHP
jgi:hypothetical protein